MPVAINTTRSTSKHTKSFIESIRKQKTLPFEGLLCAEKIANLLSEHKYRERIYTPAMTISTFLAQVMGEDQSCQQAVAQTSAWLASQGSKMPSVNTAGYCKARKRLPESVLSGLAKETAEDMEKEAISAMLWRNRHIKLPDGTTVSMPDTVANQQSWPQVRTQKKGLDSPLPAWLACFHCPQVHCSIWP